MRYDHETRKKRNLVRLVLCVFMGSFGILALGLCFSVQAELGCGGAIGPGGIVKLTSNLNCVGGPGLTVTGPATLNLNGHTVSGPATGSGTGILVQGEGAEILNGKVKSWDTAVDVRGVGNHRIVNLKIENNKVGIRVRTDKNSVTNNCVRDNSDRGIRVGGDANRLTNNSIANSNKGIRIDEGSDNNIVVSNTMVNNDSENCDIKGNDNLLVNNLAKNAAEECFSIGDVEQSTIAATGNRLVNNTAFKCKKGGFVVAAGTYDNYLVHNTALGNSHDLQDANENCETNTWLMNIAYSANPKCTKARIWDIMHSICY
jgi:parallel beta-helix repeat protein